MTRDVVLLTKSTKRGGYCVAGVDAETGEWVRLVSPVVWSHGALTDEHMTYADGTACEVLDCVRVEVKSDVGITRQPENVLIDVRQKFEKLGTWDLDQVLKLHPAETPEFVYGNKEPYLMEEEIGGIDRSLVLVHTDWLRIKHPDRGDGKERTKANFRYNGQWYNGISVTDPEYYQAEEGTTLTSAYLVVSLPDVPFDNGQYYKFIARIFTP